jgi:F-type H+-transporting ATPase subunit delta
VTSRGAAVRYAKALFDTVLAERQDLVETDRQLSGFSRMVAANAALSRVLTNPAIPAARKRAVVEQLIAQAGSFAPTVAKLLLMLAERDRLALLADVADGFEQRLMDYQKVVRAEVITAVSLPADRVNALKEGLARATGLEVQVAARVDPGIIGGAVARIGSTVYDGSVTRQLERIREALTSAQES